MYVEVVVDCYIEKKKKIPTKGEVQKRTKNGTLMRKGGKIVPALRTLIFPACTRAVLKSGDDCTTVRYLPYATVPLIFSQIILHQGTLYR